MLLAVVKNTFSKIIFATTKTFISSPQDFAVAKTFFYDDRKKQFFMFAKIFCDSDISFFATAKIFFSQLKRIISCGLGNAKFFGNNQNLFFAIARNIFAVAEKHFLGHEKFSVTTKKHFFRTRKIEKVFLRPRKL